MPTQRKAAWRPVAVVALVIVVVLTLGALVVADSQQSDAPAVSEIDVVDDRDLDAVVVTDGAVEPADVTVDGAPGDGEAVDVLDVSEEETDATVVTEADGELETVDVEGTDDPDTVVVTDGADAADVTVDDAPATEDDAVVVLDATDEETLVVLDDRQDGESGSGDGDGDDAS